MHILQILALIAISSVCVNAEYSIVALSTDGSSRSYTGTGILLTIARTIDDGFVYDPNNFGATNPYQGSLAFIDNGTDSGFHGNSSNTHYLRYTLDEYTILHHYGNSRGNPSCWHLRQLDG